MATRPTIPYYAPPESLPAPLPTVAEILASKERLSNEHQVRVFRVREHYAVKFGTRTSIQEGENMLFVQQSTSIPVPKVYALFQAAVEGWKPDPTFIVMEYIPGTTLRTRWPTLSAPEKRLIVSQLRRHISELRSIPSPGYYGGIWRQPGLDKDFVDKFDPWDPYCRGPEISGPHETEEQFVEAMWRCYDKACVYGDGRPGTRDRFSAWVRAQYHAAFKGHRSVFTHADLADCNFMFREDGSVVITDWEHAGWYPSFYEYCTASTVVGHLNDWDEWVYDIFEKNYAASWAGSESTVSRSRDNSRWRLAEGTQEERAQGAAMWGGGAREVKEDGGHFLGYYLLFLSYSQTIIPKFRFDNHHIDSSDNRCEGLLHRRA